MGAASLPVQSWRELYRGALYETDGEKQLLRIADAERALILRAREVFVTPVEHYDEAQAIDDAMYMLRALRNCLKLKTRDLEAA